MTSYFYVPYVLNHGYNNETPKDRKLPTADTERVAHELAQLTIPDQASSTAEESSRLGRANSGFSRNKATSLEAQQGTDSMNMGSYSYVDENGNLKTTKDIFDVYKFGFKVPRTKVLPGSLSSPLASKVHTPTADQTNNPSTSDQEDVVEVYDGNRSYIG